MESGSLVVNEADQDLMDLPPGFRFHPTDEEIINHYLKEKVTNPNFSAKAIGEVDLNKNEPWDLPKKAKMGEKEWFFFCQRDRKYPTGMRTNRATESGYWKATGKDKEIFNKGKGNNNLVGMKKTLVFYKGRAPKGEKTNWVMHEFRLEGKFAYYNQPKSAKDEWVVCKVFHKNNPSMRRSSVTDLVRMNSFVDNLFDESPSLPPLMDLPNSSNTDAPSSSFSKINDQDEFKNFFLNQNSFTFNPTFQPNNQAPNPIFYSQFSSNIPTYQASSSSMGNYLDQERIGSIFKSNYNLEQCKVEQFSSNQSGISTDVNAEISSKEEMGASVGPLSDYDSMWNF